jgi:molybdenum cofactor biosynthesis enzyme
MGKEVDKTMSIHTIVMHEKHGAESDNLPAT